MRVFDFGFDIMKAVFSISTASFFVFFGSHATWAQDFGGTGRELTYGFGDVAEGLQRDAETFGLVGGEFTAHVGIDIEAPAGTPVYAAAAGEVTSPGSVTRDSANEVVIIGEAATEIDLM